MRESSIRRRLICLLGGETDTQAPQPQHQQDPGREARERQKHEDNAKIISALNRVADQLVATERQESRVERLKAIREYLTIFLVFATVLAAGIGDCFFYGQLREMQSSGADSQKLITANGKLADAAAKQAIAAQT